jgi:hypothetical protein
LKRGMDGRGFDRGSGREPAPPSPVERRELQRLRALKRSSSWVLLVWLPLAVTLVALGRAELALAFALGGGAYAALIRCFVCFSRCPRCGHRYASAPGGSAAIWSSDECAGCGLRFFRR